MIDRYCLEEMKKVWNEENKIKYWIDVEKALIHSLGVSEIADKNTVDSIIDIINSNKCYPYIVLLESHKIEKTTKHDLAAFVDALSNIVEKSGVDSRWIHFGLTSSDVVDTALSLQICEAIELVEKSLYNLNLTLKNMSVKYKKTPIMGRTHGMHAEPTTFGLVLFNYYKEFLRHVRRLNDAYENIRFGKLSGAVGTFSHITKDIELIVMNKLGLKCAPTSNQILQRDRHAEVFNTIALLGCSIEKLATQIRIMQRTEIGEVQEGFSVGQKGSSAMAHKKNPILSENICGLSRLLRGYAQSSMEDIALWGERDISHSSVERVIAPDAFNLIYFMLERMNDIMSNLVVNENKMIKNILDNKDLWTSQTIMLQLIKGGKTRQEAYKIVQDAALQFQNEVGERTFLTYIILVLKEKNYKDEQISEILKHATLENHLRNVESIIL